MLEWADMVSVSTDMVMWLPFTISVSVDIGWFLYRSKNYDRYRFEKLTDIGQPILIITTPILKFEEPISLTDIGEKLLILQKSVKKIYWLNRYRSHDETDIGLSRGKRVGEIPWFSRCKTNLILILVVFLFLRSLIVFVAVLIWCVNEVGVFVITVLKLGLLCSSSLIRRRRSTSCRRRGACPFAFFAALFVVVVTRATFFNRTVSTSLAFLQPSLVYCMKSSSVSY